MDYISTSSIPNFDECAACVAQEGFTLVELQIVPQHGMVHVSAVIASKDPSKDIGISDCSKVHHALGPKMLLLLNKTEDEVSMEVCSPGLERNLKNAAEFAFFTGREVRVWDKTVSDWIKGVILGSDESQVTLQIEDGSSKSVEYANIAKAKFVHS